MKLYKRNITASADRDYEDLAMAFGDAIRDLGTNEEALKNFVSYLTYSTKELYFCQVKYTYFSNFYRKFLSKKQK